MKVGVDRRGWNDGDPRRRRWSLTTAAAFRRGCSPAVDRRWGNSFRGSRRFSQATWRELGRPEGHVPTATRDGGMGEARRRGECGAQGRRWRGWRASRDHGEAARGEGVAREGAGRADDGGQGLQQRSGESSRTEERRRQQRAREG
jgi:hypothetical protein